MSIYTYVPDHMCVYQGFRQRFPRIFVVVGSVILIYVGNGSRNKDYEETLTSLVSGTFFTD